ncbi:MULTISPECIES: EAL domain-containing protein [Actinomycetes]|uniref:sensor domain-containing phosphodiesterase n=1 Tax=Actinomycetes TaxID=1760 RepID=UPI0012DD08DB|nr:MULTISPECIES: EAL domain-containing protein [Actinomycetes]
MNSAGHAHCASDAGQAPGPPTPDPRVLDVLRTPESVRAVRPVFQPIVHLATGTVVGAEALARWPEVPGVDPSAVINHARDQGRVAEVDRACRNAALQTIAAHGHLEDGMTVFINVEPDALVDSLKSGTIFDTPAPGSRIVLELTERALLDNPAELLNVVLDARARGVGIALDDVGRHPDSLTLLSLIAPDVVKLDGSLIASAPTREQLHAVTTVRAYAEATGTVILAEGIETDAHLRRAVDLGATLGQGWHLGRPAPLPPHTWPPIPPDEQVPINSAPAAVPDQPSQLITRRQVATKQVLVRYSRYLEHHAATLAEPVTILASFQHATHFTDRDAQRYAALAAANPLVAVIATDLPPDPAAGVRGTTIADDHPLADEWTLVILGRHFFAALIARDLHTDTPRTDHDRRFTYTLTYNRDTVTAAGRALLRHMH